jgi:tRNA-splicing ligase RtcB
MYVLIDNPELQVPVKSWLPPREIEAGAMQQLVNIANHPEIGPHVAVMPDCHVGYGVPIGCVAATIDAVIPNAVGVDIGCGLHAIQTGIPHDPDRMDQRFWREWGVQATREVPTGFASHKTTQRLGPLERKLQASSLQPLLAKKAAFQLGTLGGGNHFLEAQVDEENQIWLMVHSGSRHTGLQIANYYNRKAIESTERRGLAVVKDLASLPLYGPLGQDYIADMTWATDFALANREQMGRMLLRSLHQVMEKRRIVDAGEGSERIINIHHNFAQLEEHFGLSMMVHRKGATSAREGQYGVIPGSMGTRSYIVRGLGNPDSFMSCSHGAGRVMGRNVARKAITAEVFAASLAGTHSRASMSYVDEAPGAYKDIDIVIERQRDLIEVMHTLRPVMTLKGDSRARED